MCTTNPPERKEIRQIVRRIVSRFHPDKIIFFGSYARGEAGPSSDVDLLIVMPFAGSKREKQVEIRLALQGIRIQKDIVVTTPEDFLWRREIPGTIERPAALEGRVLYARP
jgi:predicted nucleotidyltransferase